MKRLLRALIALALTSAPFALGCGTTPQVVHPESAIFDARTAARYAFGPRTVESTLLELLASTDGTKEADLGHGVRAVREYECLSLERGPVRFGPWTISSDVPGLAVRAWHHGDRLHGRTKKVQDVFVDAKVPRRERASWPLVVAGDEVVCVPGIVEDPQVRWERVDDEG